MATFNEIFNTLKTAYFETTGETEPIGSDLEARFKAVASELFSLSCYGEWALKQAFPQSATGEQLDLHAQLRGIERKTASPAEGELTFYINEASAESISVPSGTVCAITDKPFVQFETLENAAIAAGDTECTVSARAITPGESSNAAAGEIDVMVNPPSGVAGVRNDYAFCGGCDEESDTSLRRRICSSYSVPQAALSVASVKELLLTVEEILDCLVSFDYETYTVCVKTKSGSVSSALEDEITSLIIGTQAMCYSVDVSNAQAEEFDLVVSLSAISGDVQTVIQKAEAAVRDLCSNLEINTALSLNKIAFAVSSVDGVGYCEVASPQALGGTVYSDAESYPKLRELRVVCDE